MSNLRPLPAWRTLFLAGSALALLPSAAVAYQGPAAATREAAIQATILRQIALAQALPRGLRRQRLLALAGAAADPYGIRAAALAGAFGRAGEQADAALAVVRARTAADPMPRAIAVPLPAENAAPVLAVARPVSVVPPPPPFADPAATLAFDRAVLARDPASAGARQEAVRAALQLQDSVAAQQLADEGVANDPNDPGAWMAAASVAQHGKDDRLALLDLQRARDLRSQQIGSDTGAGLAGGQTLDETQSLPPATPVQAADLGALPPGGDVDPGAVVAPGGTRTAQTVYTNPFRDQQQGVDTEASPPESSDPMTRQIDSTLASLQAEIAPQVAAELDITGRSGQGGLSNLGSVSIPIEATFSPDGFGKLRLSARPTYLFAGKDGSAPLDQAQFGTLAFGVRGRTLATLTQVGPGVDYQDARGVSLDADYAYSWFEGDVGTTPLGFLLHSVVGGIQLTPRLTDDVGLELVAERRAVTDSLFAYAGAQDPRTGNHLGGVTRNRVYAQLNFNAPGNGFYYVGVGGSKLYGENVRHNTELEAGAGVNYPIWETNTDTVRLGLNLVYFGFDRNLEYFTLGQGGYFSPQSYFAALVPISYSERLGRLSYLVSGTVGLQTFHAKGTPFYPTDAALQAALEARAGTVADLQTAYGGRNNTGPTGGVHGEVQYELTRNIHVGGEASFQSAGDFQEGEGLVYARYIFDGVR